MKKFLLLFFIAAAAMLRGENCTFKSIFTVKGELQGTSGHMQGICASDDALYFAHQKGIFKLDWNGKMLKHVPADNHTGDLCFYNGKVYSSIAYYDQAHRGKGAIVEYSSDLEELRRYELDFPIDGIAVLNGFFYFGAGPNPRKGHRGNRLGKLSADFSGKISFVKIDHGYKTCFGTQAITVWKDQLFVSFYGSGTPMASAIFDGDGKLIAALKFSANIGFEALPPRFRSARPRFLRLVPIYDRKKGETPHFRLDFYEYRGGKMIRISR